MPCVVAAEQGVRKYIFGRQWELGVVFVAVWNWQDTDRHRHTRKELGSTVQPSSPYAERCGQGRLHIVEVLQGLFGVCLG